MDQFNTLKESLNAKIFLLFGIENGFVILCFTIIVMFVSFLYLMSLHYGIDKGTSSNLLSEREKDYRKDKKQNAYLLLGCSGSGKTSLFHKLIGSKFYGTVTSMVENRVDNFAFERTPSTDAQGTENSTSSEPKIISLIDVPGHERLRFLWSKVLKRNNVKGIIFLIEAPNFSVKAAGPVAEYLYSILTTPDMDNGPPILLCCHKSDVSTARRPISIQKLITSELEKLRRSRETSNLGVLKKVANTRYGGPQTFETNENEENDSLPLGNFNKPLELEKDAPCKIQFVATSLTNYQAIEEFIYVN